MAIAHLVQNTDKTYPCVSCGSKEANIIREGADPRVKCNTCNFTYDASDSLKAQEKGSIPDSPPELADPAPTPTEVSEPDKRVYPPPPSWQTGKDPLVSDKTETSLPRTLAYLIVSKDRKHFAFCNNKNFNKQVMQWEAGGMNYEVYQLQPKKVEANVTIE